MIDQLIKEWQDALAIETDTRKYRLIMQTIAFLESVKDYREVIQNRAAEKQNEQKAHS